MKIAGMNVDLVDHMGNDLSIVNAARVSFDKVGEWQDVEYIDEQSDIEVAGTGVLSEGDTKLIGYLAKHNHWSPFSHAFMSFRIKAPIFVARQMVKHQVGLAWNEVSRRYVDDSPEFFAPDGWRGKPDGSIKQGSGTNTVPIVGARVPVVLADSGDWSAGNVALINHTKLCDAATRLYEHMIAEGVAPEMARMVLPQSMMTEWIWSGSVYAFARVCNLRLDPHAQAESRVIADAIHQNAKELFPASWAALVPYE